MALKDWRKTKITKKDEFYRESKDNAIAIVKASSLTHAKSGYLVLIEKSKTPKYFKTKSQALKFAKQYMRLH